MIKLLIDAKEYFRRVFEKELSFENFLKLIRDGNSKTEDKHQLISLVGTVFRRFYLFDRLVSSLDKEADYYLMLILLANYYLKIVDQAQVISGLNNLNRIEYLELFAQIQDTNRPSELIDATVVVDPSLDWHERYNLPLWIIKSLINHYGLESTRIILMNTIYLKQHLYCVYRLDALPRLLCEGFKPTIEKEYLISDKASYFVSQDVFRTVLAFKEIVTCADLLGQVDLAYYLEDLLALPFEFALKYQEDASHLVLTPDVSRLANYVLAKNLIKIKKFEVVNSDVPTMISHLSKKYDAFVVSPQSTAFSKIMDDPSWLITFNQEEYDKVINNQLAALNEASLYLNDNGLLIYYVNTIMPKETKEIVKKFLKNNSTYLLVKESLNLNLKKTHSASYYAVLRKHNG